MCINHVVYLSAAQIQDLVNQGKLRNTPDIIIFGKHRFVCKVCDVQQTIFNNFNRLIVGYAVIDLITNEIY